MQLKVQQCRQCSLCYAFGRCPLQPTLSPLLQGPYITEAGTPVADMWEAQFGHLDKKKVRGVWVLMRRGAPPVSRARLPWQLGC